MRMFVFPILALGLLMSAQVMAGEDSDLEAFVQESRASVKAFAGTGRNPCAIQTKLLAAKTIVIACRGEIAENLGEDFF